MDSGVKCPICLEAEACKKLCLPNLNECDRCHHIFEWPPNVTAVYDSEYIKTYDNHKMAEAMSYLRLGVVKTLLSIGPNKLLDVGYGNGSFVKLAVKAGINAYGCDVHGVDYGVQDVPLVSETWWDLVTFFDSLEHFPDLSPIRHLGNRADKIVVTMPELPEDWPQSGEPWKHYKPGEHLHYFSAYSLMLLFKKSCARYDVEDVIRGRNGHARNITTYVLR